MKNTDKQKISPQIYIELINQKIEKMDGYIPGMSVYLVPNDSCPLGYDFDEKWRLNGHIQILLSQAVHELSKDYEIDVSLNPLQ